MTGQRGHSLMSGTDTSRHSLHGARRLEIGPVLGSCGNGRACQIGRKNAAWRLAERFDRSRMIQSLAECMTYRVEAPHAV